jgi:hypothetical protein
MGSTVKIRPIKQNTCPPVARNACFLVPQAGSLGGQIPRQLDLIFDGKANGFQVFLNPKHGHRIGHRQFLYGYSFQMKIVEVESEGSVRKEHERGIHVH